MLRSRIRSARRAWRLYEAHKLGVLVDRDMHILSREEHYRQGVAIKVVDYKKKASAWNRMVTDTDERRWVERVLRGANLRNKKIKELYYGNGD